MNAVDTWFTVLVSAAKLVLAILEIARTAGDGRRLGRRRTLNTRWNASGSSKDHCEALENALAEIKAVTFRLLPAVKRRIAKILFGGKGERDEGLPE